MLENEKVNKINDLCLFMKKGPLAEPFPNKTKAIYFLLNAHHRTITATKPTRPSEPSTLTIPTILPTTSIPLKKGIAVPPNRTCKTTSIATAVKPRSVIWDAHPFTFAKISILFHFSFVS